MMDLGWIKPYETTEADIVARLGRPRRVRKGDDFLSHGGDFFADTLVYRGGIKIDVNCRDRLVRKIVVGRVECIGYSVAGGCLPGRSN